MMNNYCPVCGEPNLCPDGEAVSDKFCSPYCFGLWLTCDSRTHLSEDLKYAMEHNWLEEEGGDDDGNR